MAKKSLADLQKAMGAAEKPVKVLEEPAKPKTTKPSNSGRKKKTAGRPPIEEKRSFKVTLSLTEKEGQALEQNAGMVPLARFLLSKLHETGVFDEK